eukprot:scaffold13326_cov204-Alexandrium_tamarense.AAC.14
MYHSLFIATLLSSCSAFAPSSTSIQRHATPSNVVVIGAPSHVRHSTQLSMSATNDKIQSLVDENPVLLFMKGSKLFPQCGFSNTACQILQSYNIDFHTVDVLADEEVRQGVKVFSDWPTIPQLYVCGEFIGGSDIMIEMYQSGELGEMIEKAKADMM